MGKLIYDVAMTVDGYICGLDGSIDGMTQDEEHVPDYRQRLETYHSVVMGRRTYEFGYAYGLKPGDRAYPHMKHYVFSTSLELESDGIQIISEDPAPVVAELKQQPGTIYLCGGGSFAGYMLDHQLIDQWVIKLNPVTLGSGIRAFGESRRRVQLHLIEQKSYSNGVVLLRYDVAYE